MGNKKTKMQNCSTLKSWAANFEREASKTGSPLSQTYFNDWCFENEECHSWAQSKGP